ncbi:MAG TPA: AraC family transcriptional regulator [Acetobacteraceae bacterium]|nr:AraC family transcriptional regulator [Acetobacteraceae bacterium]
MLDLASHEEAPTQDWTLAVEPEARRASAPGVFEERRWRDLGALVDAAPDGRTLISHWVDPRSFGRRERAVTPVDRYVIGVALRGVKMSLISGADTLSEGTVPVGMIHVTKPGQVLDAEFHGPCDFIHFHVAADRLEDRRAALAIEANLELDGLHRHDPLAAQLARTLIDGGNGCDPQYQESVAQTIVTRVLTSWRPACTVHALPKWRLRRVQGHIVSHIAERISLGDLASAAGLSRMHFAAQFRAATGFRPHAYLVHYRIEFAKTLIRDQRMSLVQTALSVGFQTQAHFTTVFRRITGETPGEWRRCNQAERPGAPIRASGQSQCVSPRL